MSILYINTGTNSNSGNGDSIRVAFTKVNQNFDIIQAEIDNIANVALNPLISNLTVTNIARFLGDVYFGENDYLSINSSTGKLLINNQPLLGNYSFAFDSFITPKNAYIASTSTYIHSPRMSLREVPGITTGSNSSTLIISAGPAQLGLYTETVNNGDPKSVAAHGVIYLTTSSSSIAGNISIGADAFAPTLGIFTASTGSTFEISSTSGNSPDYATALLSLNTGTLTGVMANGRGVWINGGSDGVTIANENYGWNFNAAGGLVFPDGSVQTTALSNSFDQSLNTFDSVQFLDLKSTGTIYQGTAYDSIDIPGTTIRVDSDQPNYTQIFVKNHNTNTTATSDLMIFNDQGTADTNYIDIGINSSNYSEAGYGLHTPGSGYLFTKDVDLVIGTEGVNTKLFFHAGGDGVNDSAMELDGYALRINRSVQTIVGTPGPLNFTIKNTLNNSAAQAIYQAMNNAEDFLKIGINSSNPGAFYGKIGPRDAFVHLEGTTATLHLGGAGDLVFWSEESTGGYEDGTTATLVMSKADRSSTFGGHVMPADDLAYDLGSSSTQWRSLWVGTSTIYIGRIPLTIDTATNKLIVGSTDPTTSTNLATESFVIDYVAQHGGGGGITGLQSTNGNPSSNGDLSYTLAIDTDHQQNTVYLRTYQGANQKPSIQLGRMQPISRGENAIAIGNDDVGYEQGDSSIAIGYQAGWADTSGIGENSIAIGTKAGYSNAANNSIILNATGLALNANNSGLYIKPVREDTGNTVKTVYYNTTTGEMTYADPTGGGSNSYTPEVPDHWNEPTVNTVQAALDELAAKIAALQNYEIDGGNAFTPAAAELIIDGNGA